MTVWTVIGAVGSFASAIVAAWAAHQSRLSASKANAAATAMLEIERDRRHAELRPRLRLRCEPWGEGTERLWLRVMLLGPPGLRRLDCLTVTIRDDHFRRGEGMMLQGGPSRDEVKQQIWGPYQFTPGTGPDDARADDTGRRTRYPHELPVGEELPFQLERTAPPPWWQIGSNGWRERTGSMIRLAIEAKHGEYWGWTLPCELDPGDGDRPVTVEVP